MLQLIAALLGAALIVTGLALVAVPLAIIVAGAGLLAFGLLHDVKPHAT